MAEGVLLDTCILLDYLVGKLELALHEKIEAFPKRYVSVTAAWEIDLKPELRNLFSFEMLQDAFRNMGVKILSITLDHIGRLRTIPRFPDHRDPFDRILIAQAYAQNLAIATYDAQFRRYPALQLL